MNDRQQVIDKLRNQGVNVFHLGHKSKVPVESWAKYQSEKFEGQIPEDHNYAVVCGKVSDNTIVFDFDNAKLEDVNKVFPSATNETLVVKTKRGYHVYFKTTHLPKNVKLTKGSLMIDLQSEGKYVVGATSTHPDGIKYEIVSNDTKVKLIDCKQVLGKMQKNGFVINGGKDSQTLTGAEIAKGDIPNGQLHDSFLKYCHHLLYKVKITDLHTYQIETERWNQSGNNEFVINKKDFERVRKDAWDYFHNEQSEEPMRDRFDVKLGKKEFAFEILDHAIQNLRPITLLDDNTRMVLVYLPTRKAEKVEPDEEPNEVEFENHAFMICSGQEKKVLPIEDSYLKKNFRIKILDHWNESRWDKEKIFAWRDNSDKVNPKEAFDLMLSTIKDYLDFESEADYVYFALWNFHTYFYELFDSTPYNDYNGLKRTGKSKAMEFQKNVCFNSLMSADISTASFFRSIEGTGSTLLLDETENFSNKKDEKAQANRTLLMQGFLKDQFAIRSEGKSDSGFVPQMYNLFSPKSIAHIKPIDDVFADRCIQSIMKRSKNKQLLNKWINKKDSRFLAIRDYCYRLFLDYGHVINDLQDEAGKILSISGRELLIWKPIITLALFFQNAGCEGLTAKIITKSSSSSENRQIEDEESQDLKILTFVSKEGMEIDEDWKLTKSLYSKLIENKEEYSINPEYFTRNSFTSILYRLGFKKKRDQRGICWLIDEDSIKDCKERFGMLEPEQTTL